ncbi:GBS Bsp-like repeat-containing protein [Streptococcus gallolyticus subsp. gallolyticus]|uniref:GBS Bsp-like repeat-containing protein n=1 Tax=Streptococcus gallolyticus TaxID=315405 RepID=UPI002284E13E|nr:GBS Bsp-like repeat-containing protein [Streptococcus gallolyticus]MCY7202743.1 GBS Bsp-like repeat-containing protein [Streptococcus gallolyticus subsp. gallolyticus]
MKKSIFDHCSQRFSIRKCSCGVVSVLLGITLLLGGANVSAEEEAVSSHLTEDNVILSNVQNQDSISDLNQSNNDFFSDEIEENNDSEENIVETTEANTNVNIDDSAGCDIDEVNNINDEAESSDKMNEFESDEVQSVTLSIQENTVYYTEKMLSASLNSGKSGVVGDDYPSGWKGSGGGQDTWGYTKSTCTSFVAYRLRNINKFEIPKNLGNAGEWGRKAQSQGYLVNKKPAVGAVAWSTEGTYGHVAWVAAVNGNSVVVEEYNWNWDYAYHTRTMPISSYAGFIHFKDLKSEPEKPVVKGKIEIQNQNDKAGTFDVIVTDTSSNYEIREVQLPIWSAQNDQDDIIWYRAQKQGNGTYKTSVKISDHKNDRGTYNIHLYYVLSNGQQIGIGGTQTNITDGKSENPTGKLKITNQDDKTGTFSVIIEDVLCPNGLKEIRVPVWSEKNGQDDIIWYTATKQNDSTYKVSVKISDHKNDRGTYNIHLYYATNNGKFLGVDGTQIEIKEVVDNGPTGDIAIKNKNNQTGTFDVIISNVFNKNGVKEVKVPIWSEENGQDDIIWYTASKQSDNTYKVSVKASNHKNSQGQYNVHLYYVQNDGKMIGVGGTKTDVHFISRPSIPDKGNYTFSSRASIKSEPKMSSPEIAYYDAGNKVYYDKVLFSDGHYWISYVSYTGSRRYISIT